MTTDQNYQQIYRVGGMLDSGFVGQITYTISLDQVYDELDIHFSFDKRLYSESDVRLSSLTDFRRSALQNTTPRSIPSRVQADPFCTK